ncbi:MAG: hypothetical protein KGL77_02025 [Actinomycetales bacterium]|nr:hypothetical protein [Actinomycetales bacterium]
MKRLKLALIAAVTSFAVLTYALPGTAVPASPEPSATSIATPSPEPTKPAVPELKPGVYILRGSNINLVSRESKVPVAIRNTFDSDVRVHVHVDPSNPRVIVPSSVEIVIPAGETVNAQVPVQAVAQGKVFLIVWLTTFSGIRLTKNSYVQMQVEPDIEITLLASFAGLVLALGVAGAIRTVRRRRKRQAEDAS